MRTALVAAVALLVAACGNQSPVRLEAGPANEAQTTTAAQATSTSAPEPVLPDRLEIIPAPNSDPLVTCDAGALLAPASTLTNPTSIDEVDHPSVDKLRQKIEQKNAIFDGDWRVWAITDTAAEFYTADGRNYVYVDKNDNNNKWRLTGTDGGPGGEPRECELRLALPEGLKQVRIGTDPDTPFSADDPWVVLGVSDGGCSSGQGPIVFGPEVIETETDVTIAFAAIPRKGNHTCEGSQPKRVVVDLSRPLGDRVVLDGTVFPAVQIDAR